jgi:hypothetical protein
MKSCILSLLWPKKDVVAFLSDHGCSPTDLPSASDYAQLSRAAIVDGVFNRLTLRPDGGLGEFRAMLQSLLQWSQFDPYYFDDLKKLSRESAEKNLEHLRQLREIRDAKIQEERDGRISTEAASQQPKVTLAQLRDQYLALHSNEGDRQRRGYALEEILLELAKLSALEVTEPFKVMGEQIDGALKFDGEHYLLEAKWQEKEASNEPVYQFAAKVEGKMYGRGVFVSVHGFSENVVESLTVGKAIRTVFVDGEDLVLLVEGLLTFKGMLDRKVKAAQTHGYIYVHPITEAPKLKRK